MKSWCPKYMTAMFCTCAGCQHPTERQKIRIRLCRVSDTIHWIYKLRQTTVGGKQKLVLILAWREIFSGITASFYYCPLLQAATFLPYIYRPRAQVTVSYAGFGQKWKTSNCTTVIALLRTKKVAHLFYQNDQDQS